MGYPYFRKHPCMICIVYVYTIKRETSWWESLRAWKVHSKLQLGSIGLLDLTRMLLSVVHFQHFELEHGVLFAKHVFFTQELSKTSNIHIHVSLREVWRPSHPMWGIWTRSLCQIAPPHPPTKFWVVATQILFVFIPKIGEDSQFDEHIFQLGWFNDQPEIYKQIEISQSRYWWRYLPPEP